MSVESLDATPDIRVKETVEETPMYGSGFLHIDFPNATFGIDPDEEISPGEIDLHEWDDQIGLSFVFDTLNADINAPSKEFGFYMDADTAELLAGWLAAYAEYVRVGTWTHPEADDE